MKKNEIALEIGEITGKTLLSLFPVGGTLVTCVWDSIKSHSVQKRMDEWTNLIENRLCTIEKTLEEIGDNEVFASAMMRATEIAIKTAEREKLEYLANAVKKTVEIDINESVVMMYMHMIDEYTAWHLKILEYFRNPKKYVSDCNCSIGSAIYPLLQAYPDMTGNGELVEKIVYDMQNSGLLTKGDFLRVCMSASGMLAKRTTKLGDDFLIFLE